MIPEDLVYYEQAAAAQIRGLGIKPVSWGEILAAGQAGMAAAQANAPADGRRGPGPWQPVARMLDSASRGGANLDPGDRSGIALLASVAYGVQGNIPAATALARRAQSLGRNISPLEASAIATVSPSLIGNFLGQALPDSVRAYLEDLNEFFDTGAPDTRDRLRGTLISLFGDNPTPFETVLMGAAVEALPTVTALGIAQTVAGRIEPLTTRYVGTVLREGIRTFLPPQRDAIRSDAVLGTGNAVISMPTSTGKTLLGELATVASLEDGPGYSCYVTPYVALGQQVAQVFRRRSASELRIHPLIGGYRLPDPLAPRQNREVVVATLERFDALLRSESSNWRDLRCVVIDEAHLVGNGDRGIRLEGLITRLRLLQAQGAAFRIVLLSAVLSNAAALSTWLGEHQTTLVSESWRPTARRTVFWAADGNLMMLVGDDPVRRQEQTASSVFGLHRLPWPHPNMYPPRNFGQEVQQRPVVFENVAYLVDYLLATDEGSVLCVCASKASTRGLAAAIAARRPSVDILAPSVERIVRRIEARYPFLTSLAEVVIRGVAYHNASVPPDVRELIEQAVRADELSVVVATTTLAEGVDLPFRFTVLADWLFWSEEGNVPMSPLLFRNIAGRSGRSGWYTDGDTYVFDNVVGPQEYTASQVRRTFQRSIFATDELPPLTSVMSTSSLLQTRATAALSAQFLGAIPENDQVDHLVRQFSRRSFAGTTGADQLLRNVLDDIRSDILDTERGALATAASPLHLTPFGASANLTGLSPLTCRTIVATLAAFTHVEPPSSLGANLLQAVANVPEQSNDRLRSKLTNPRARYLVGADDLQDVFSGWLSGAPEDELFMGLGYVRRSSRHPTAAEWLGGRATSASWHEEFDKFMEFIQGTTAGFLPWIMRGCGQLQVYSPTSPDTDWNLLADMFETGTDSAWAVAASRDGAPASRRVLAMLGRLWSAEYVTDADPLGLQWIRARQAEFDAAVQSVRIETRSNWPGLDPEVEELVAWLEGRA